MLTPRKQQNHNYQAWIFSVVSDPFQAEAKTEGIADTLVFAAKKIN
jgi:hypothetical protein